MWWLWIAAPITAALIFVLTAQVDRRALEEIEGFREALASRRRAGQKKGKKKKSKDLRPKKIGKLAPELGRVAELAGGGQVHGTYEIVPGVAYATFVTGDLGGSSDHQTVLVRLEEPGPSFLARPLPWSDGAPGENVGITFRKDPAFMQAYLVEADVSRARAVGRFLSRSLRELLCESGEVWLRVEGKAMALSIYGTIREEKIARLLEIADLFVAEHGAEGGPSLFGEDEEARAARLADDEEEEVEDEEEEDEEEGEDEEADESDEDDGEEDDDDDASSKRD